MNFITYNKYLNYSILFVLIYFVVFFKLDSFHLRWWDESMFAVNTYEMMNNGNYFSLFFDGHPDLFNTKPPLTSWVQIIFVKLLGYNELAIRLPSAIASAITIFIVFNFCKKYLNNYMAWLSSLVLLTSLGFIGFHTSRTGDSDSILTLFLLLTNINFIKYLIKSNGINILFFFIFLTLAFATKLYAALLFTPAYLILLIYYNKLKEFIFNKSFILGFLFFIFLGLSLIFIREYYTEGYINKILLKDAGRLFNGFDNHKESFLYYIDLLFLKQYSYWIIFSLLSFFILSNENNYEIKIIYISLMFLVSIYLLIISLAVTKLYWYTVVIFPYLSILSSYSIFTFINQFLNKKKRFFFIFLLFIYPYYIVFHQSQVNKITQGERNIESNELYIFNAINDKKNLNGIKVLTQKWKGSLLFYKYKLIDNNQDIFIIDSIVKIKKGDKVLVSDSNLKAKLQKHFNLVKIDQNQKAVLYFVKNINYFTPFQ